MSQPLAARRLSAVSEAMLTCDEGWSARYEKRLASMTYCHEPKKRCKNSAYCTPQRPQSHTRAPHDPCDADEVVRDARAAARPALIDPHIAALVPIDIRAS